MITYSDVYINHSAAHFAALSADDQWQQELDFRNIDRYSPEARGVVGECSQLRLLYEAKLQADEDLRNATDALRASGTPREIEAYLKSEEV